MGVPELWPTLPLTDQEFATIEQHVPPSTGLRLARRERSTKALPSGNCSIGYKEDGP